MRLVMLTIVAWLMLVITAQGAAGTTLTANGETIDGASINSKMVGGRLFVPLRFVAESLGAEVYWNPVPKEAHITYEDLDVQLLIDSNLAFVNGQKVILESAVFVEQDRTLVPLRFVSESLGWEVDWLEDERTVVIRATDEYALVEQSLKISLIDVSSQEAQVQTLSLAPQPVIPYTEDEFNWLTKLIEAEASGESLEGKIAVGACIVNRVKSNQFPNTVKEVIFHQDEGGYYQYTPVKTGYIYKVTPSKDSIEAAQRALMGEDPTSGSIYFYNPKTSRSKWILSRPIVKQIGNHAFAK